MNTPTFTSTGTITSTPANTFTPGPPAPNFTLSSGVTTLQPGTYTFGAVNITGSAVVTLGGPVTIFASSFNLGAGATIRGLGYWDTNDLEVLAHANQNYSTAHGLAIPSYPGAPTGNGPGNGMVNNLGGGGVGEDYTSGGGGHGGAGGSGYNPTCEIANGGGVNDNPVHPILMGSGGGSPPGTEVSPAGWGGGLIWIVVYDPVSNKVAPAVINGTIDMDGLGGCAICGTDGESGAGGAGGAILVEASTITGSGLLTANGGNSGYGLGPEGNGGGGIISLIESLTSFSGTMSSIAGNGAIGNGCLVSSQGGIGSVTFTAAPANGY
jgi:hypothetical protein